MAKKDERDKIGHMLVSDLMMVLAWWVVWCLIGVSSMPLTLKWLGNLGSTNGDESTRRGLWDKGYGLAKIFGWVAVGYVVWLGASLRIWSFGMQTIWLVVLGWVGINLLVVRGQKSEFRRLVEENWRLWVKLELIFLGAMGVWAIVRAYQPDINGLEKFMDFGFMNSVMQSRYFPPADMWFAGGTINYYYFGHYLSGLMTMWSGIKPAVAYNLMIATLFGLCVSGAVSVGGSLAIQIFANENRINKKVRRWVVAGGLLAAFLLAVRGNLHTASYFVNKWTGWNSSLLPTIKNAYWYPDATRYIPFTIHEFPLYSFVVADLHAHLMNLPIVLLLLGGVVSGVSRVRGEGRDVIGKLQSLWGKLKRDGKAELSLSDLSIRWWEVGIWGWLLGVFAMTNAWDVPIYGLVIGVTLGIIGLTKIDWKAAKQEVGKQIGELVKQLGLIGGILVGLTIMVSLPFQMHFEQIAKGILPVEANSEISKLLVLWGWDLFLFVSLLMFVIGVRRVDKGSRELKALLVDYVMLGWYGVGWLLILIPELVYVKDIYIADYHRANTMFKLVYQSWILFAFAGAYTIVRLVSAPLVVWNNKYLKYGWIMLVVLGLVAVGSYPRFAIRDYYNGLKVYRGLDGEAWLKNKYADDFAGIEWLRELEGFISAKAMADRQPVVLEAVGDSYTEFDRVSAYTGYPTIQGWLVHEWLWRGSFDEPGARQAEVEKVYTSVDLEEVRKILSKYRVEYVFVGDKEREKYPRLREENFKQLGEVVFESGETRIYRVK